MKKYLLISLLGMTMIVSLIAAAPKANAFTLRNYSTGYCLGVAADNPNPGTDLVVWTCDGTTSQQWTFTNGYGWNYLYSGIAPNTVAGVQYGNFYTGERIFISRFAGLISQMWEEFFLGNDLTGHPCYYFVSESGSGVFYVMGVAGGSRSRGAAVVIWPQFFDAYGNPDYHGHPDQYWCVY